MSVIEDPSPGRIVSVFDRIGLAMLNSLIQSRNVNPYLLHIRNELDNPDSFSLERLGFANLAPTPHALNVIAVAKFLGKIHERVR
jgi:hypothetical protein